jgi:hypothetical protein
MRSATRAMPADTNAPPPAVTPTDRRDAPGYEREPDDASGEARDERP